MTQKRRVCLVTDEIYPLTNGGIGRLLHNLIVDSRRREAPVEFHLLMPRHVPVTQAQLDSVFGTGVALHGVTLTQAGEGKLQDLDRGYYPPLAAFADLLWQAQSHQIALELMDHERLGLVFDEIEFTDFRGQAFAAINEKRLGRGLLSSRLTVRIHSTFGAIRFFEPYPLSYRDLMVRELERKALLEADQVIAHLPAIAAFNRDFYGFDEEWMRRVRIEFPPVLDRVGAAPHRPPNLLTAERPLVFASRSNPFKRPNLFIQAAAELMRRRPDYRGKAILACHIYHPEQIEGLLRSLPDDLRPRFQIQQLHGEARQQLIGSSIVVIPSAYESLSLLAYEASDAGATLVLNGKCLAFGDGSPFHDGTNCLEFDGTVDGLVSALERAIAIPVTRLEPVRWQATAPYWETVPSAAAAELPPRQARVSVVVSGIAARLPETLESILASTHQNLEVVVVDDGQRDPVAVALFDRLQREASNEGPVKVGRHLVQRGQAASRETGLKLSTGELVLFADAGDLLQPTLLSEATRALQPHPELAGVLPTVAYLGDEDDLASANCDELALQLGDAPTPGMLASTSALHPVWRRASLPQAAFDITLGGEGPWLAYFGALFSGARFIPTPEIGYLARRASAGPELTRDRRSALLGRLALPRRGASQRELWLASLLLELPQKPAQGATEDVSARSLVPARYGWVNLANRTLKRSGPLHGMLRQALSGALAPRGADGLPRSPSQPLRHQIADRLNATLKGVPGMHRLLQRLKAEPRQ